IRRTLPVSGDEKLLTEAANDAPRPPRNNAGAPAGARTPRNPKATSKRRFNTPRPGGERGKGGAPREAVARDPSNPLAPAKSVKPPRADGLKTKARWSTAAKKTAAR